MAKRPIEITVRELDVEDIDSDVLSEWIDSSGGVRGHGVTSLNTAPEVYRENFLRSLIGAVPKHPVTVFYAACGDYNYVWLTPTNFAETFKETLLSSLEKFLKTEAVAIIREKFRDKALYLAQHGLEYNDALTMLREVYVEITMKS